MMIATNSSKPRFPCPDCEKTFSRAEHLTRHQTLHDGSQIYKCEKCSKSFPRKDALTRHYLTHDSGPNLLEKKGRACKVCAKSKVRCSGDNPCSRCAARDLTCQFPELRPHERTTSATVLPSPEPEGKISADNVVGDDAVSINDFHSPVSPGYQRHHRESVMSREANSTHNFEGSQWPREVIPSINWLPLEFPNPDRTMMPLLPTAMESYATSHTHIGTPQSMSTLSEPSISPTRDDIYRDENTSALPRAKRQKIIARRPSDLRSRDYGWRLNWTHPIELGTSQHVADFEYESMRNAFCTLCVNCGPVMAPFISTEFPPREAFDQLIQCFFTNLHQTIPFVHRPTFNPDHEGRWVLLLAMASASSWLLATDFTDTFSESLLEFARRVTLHFDASNAWQRTFTNCRHAQIRLLLMLSTAASRDEAVKMWSNRCVSELCYLVNSAICRSYPKGQYEQSGMPPDAEWLVWSEDEQTRRTAFLVWQISILRFMEQSDGRNPVSLKSISAIRLPCNDAVFEAPDPESWQELEARFPRLTLFEALETLYVEKRLVPDLGDVAQIMLTYGVIHRTREVQEQVQNPFSRLEPSADRRSNSDVGFSSVWAPCEPLYTNWRNAGCDALDILHWQANAAIGLAAGLEPAKVLHLHFARLLMLTPLEQLLKLAHMLNLPFASSADTGRITPEEIELKRVIQRWAVNDQYKARLAAIHAGVTFWHVRRYGVNAYYEPFAVLAATLTLWALSTFSTRITLPSTPARSSGFSEMDSSSCEVILIDRPTDDELVQSFVRKGHAMRPLMSGIEEGLWSPTAPFKILREGTRILATLDAWAGETEKAIDLLEGLTMNRQQT